MNKALQYMFWGYLFIFFRIHIGIDWLPDPIGYYLICTSCFMLVDKYPHAKKVGIVSAIGVAISIPAVFINLSEPYLDSWSIYSILLLVFKLIIGYLLFSVIKSIVRDYNNKVLINRADSVFNFYISIHLSQLFLLSFSMNVSERFLGTAMFILVFTGIIIDIAFLLLLGAIRRAKPRNSTIDYSV